MKLLLVSMPHSNHAGNKIIVPNVSFDGKLSKIIVPILFPIVVNHGSHALFTQFLYCSVLMRQHVA